jgi:hypothetical protein
MRPPAFPSDRPAPTLDELAQRIGPTWSTIEEAMGGLGSLKTNWKFSKTSGWYLTVDKGGQRLFYCFPRVGGFLLKLVYNERGVQALKDARLMLDRLRTAKKYAEGTLLEFTEEDISAAQFAELLRVKAGSVKR